MNRIVILGSTGHVGAELASLLGSTSSICGVARTPGANTHIVVDLTDASAWDDMPRAADAVINAAAIVGQRPEILEQEYVLANARIPMMAAQYAKDVDAHLLHLSTAGVYGFRDDFATEATPPCPQGTYNITKLQGEEACAKTCAPDRLTILRLSFPYGPRQRRGLVPTLIKRIGTGKPVALNTPDGRPCITPLHIKDCCHAVSTVLEKRLQGVYNCSGNEGISILALSAILGNIMGHLPTFTYTDSPCKDLLVDSGALQKAIDWQPSIPLKEGLKEVVATIKS